MAEIQYARSEHRPVLMDLWRRCFSDKEEFVRFYFNRIHREEETLVLIENNVIIASLQMIPYSIKLGNDILPAGYISGAMTHPDYRRRGYMEQLLYFALGVMIKKGYRLTFLIPQEEWLFDYYSRYGYQKAFPVNYRLISISKRVRPRGITVLSSLQEADTDALYSTYHSFLSQKENVVLKSREQFSCMLEDLFLDQGKVFCCEDGIAFAVPENDRQVRMKETLWGNPKARMKLLFAVFRYNYGKEVIEPIPEKGYYYHFSGMVRPLDETINFPENSYMSMMLD